MTAPTSRPRTGLPIFLRTFLLLLAALAIAHASGMLILALRKPPSDVPLSGVVALLSSQMPSADNRLRVFDSPTAPAADADYREDPPLRRLLASWLNVDEDRVRFYRMFPTDMPAPWRPPPELRRPAPGGPAGFGSPPGPRWHADSPLLRGFVAALRQANGHWRVVERIDVQRSVHAQLLAMLLADALVVLSLAWWFSRALAAPIHRFAHAANRMGHDPDAPPLPLDGPAEIAHAAAAFNTMRSRINRLLRERMHLVGAIAHDLRTPLTRLAFRLEALPPQLRDKTAADIEEMSRMIHTTLEFLREQDRDNRYEALDLRQLVQAVVADAHDLGHDATLEPGSSAPLHGDPLALRRLVANLLGNALKYGQRARVRLLDAGDQYELQVDDDGPGIDPDRHDQLFLPFVRGDDSRNPDTGGIGLGLASARDVALAHGGDIRLRNRAGGGLRASLTLPRREPGKRTPSADATAG